MKKINFVTLLMSVVGGLVFSLGMCMCLLPQWNTFNQGVAVGIAGAVVLLAMVVVRRKMSGKPSIKLSGKSVGTFLFALLGTLVFGVGMCMTMVWNMMILGIVVGIIGMILLMCLIPLCKGIK